MNTAQILCRTLTTFCATHCQKLLAIHFRVIVYLLWHLAERRAKLITEHTASLCHDSWILGVRNYFVLH